MSHLATFSKDAKLASTCLTVAVFVISVRDADGTSDSVRRKVYAVPVIALRL